MGKMPLFMGGFYFHFGLVKVRHCGEFFYPYLCKRNVTTKQIYN